MACEPGSYVSGVPVRICEAFRPPRKVTLPASCPYTVDAELLTEEYDIRVETAALSWIEDYHQHKETKKLLQQEKIEAYRKKKKEEKERHQEELRVEAELEQERREKERLEEEDRRRLELIEEERLEIEKERAELERLGKEMMEREKMEMRKIETERIQKEIAEKERFENEKAEQTRMEHINMARLTKDIIREKIPSIDGVSSSDFEPVTVTSSDDDIVNDASEDNTAGASENVGALEGGGSNKDPVLADSYLARVSKDLSSELHQASQDSDSPSIANKVTSAASDIDNSETAAGAVFATTSASEIEQSKPVSFLKPTPIMSALNRNANGVLSGPSFQPSSAIINYADFEGDKNDPFDSAALRSINDMEELAQVLQLTQVSSSSAALTARNQSCFGPNTHMTRPTSELNPAFIMGGRDGSINSSGFASAMNTTGGVGVIPGVIPFPSGNDNFPAVMFSSAGLQGGTANFMPYFTSSSRDTIQGVPYSLYSHNQSKEYSSGNPNTGGTLHGGLAMNNAMVTMSTSPTPQMMPPAYQQVSNNSGPSGTSAHLFSNVCYPPWKPPSSVQSGTAVGSVSGDVVSGSGNSSISGSLSSSIAGCGAVAGGGTSVHSSYGMYGYGVPSTSLPAGPQPVASSPAAGQRTLPYSSDAGSSLCAAAGPSTNLSHSLSMHGPTPATPPHTATIPNTTSTISSNTTQPADQSLASQQHQQQVSSRASQYPDSSDLPAPSQRPDLEDFYSRFYGGASYSASASSTAGSRGMFSPKHAGVEDPMGGRSSLRASRSVPDLTALEDQEVSSISAAAGCVSPLTDRGLSRSPYPQTNNRGTYSNAYGGAASSNLRPSSTGPSLSHAAGGGTPKDQKQANAGGSSSFSSPASPPSAYNFSLSSVTNYSNNINNGGGTSTTQQPLWGAGQHQYSGGVAAAYGINNSYNPMPPNSTLNNSSSAYGGFAQKSLQQMYTNQTNVPIHSGSGPANNISYNNAGNSNSFNKFTSTNTNSSNKYSVNPSLMSNSSGGTSMSSSSSVPSSTNYSSPHVARNSPLSAGTDACSTANSSNNSSYSNATSISSSGGGGGGVLVLPDPFLELDPEAQSIVLSVTEMGFPRDRVARAVQRLGTQHKKLIEVLLELQSLQESGEEAGRAEVAFYAHLGDSEKTRQHLANTRQRQPGAGEGDGEVVRPRRFLDGMRERRLLRKPGRGPFN